MKATYIVKVEIDESEGILTSTEIITLMHEHLSEQELVTHNRENMLYVIAKVTDVMHLS